MTDVPMTYSEAEAVIEDARAGKPGLDQAQIEAAVEIIKEAQQFKAPNGASSSAPAPDGQEEPTAEERRQYEFAPLDDFLKRQLPKAEPLLGNPDQVYIAVGSLTISYGEDGASKSTVAVDAIAHLAAGEDWIGIEVLRPARILVIENEGPAALWQQKLADKAATWDGPEWRHNVFVYAAPWGDFSFASPTAREALTKFCDDNEVDLVVANPTLGLGVPGSGKPEETEAFVELLVECGLKTTRAFWLIHHENKSGQISGDWGRHADTKMQLLKDGNQPRTKLIWEKTRWATLPTDTEPKSVLLEWVPSTKGYTVVPIDPTGATDQELRDRIDAYLADHPRTSQTKVETDVEGTAARIRDLLKQGDYAAESGPRGATLYSLQRDSVVLFDDGPTE